MILLIKNLFFTLLVPCTVAVAVPLMMTRPAGLLFEWAILPGLVVLVLGVAIYAWCVWDFATFGRGTPAPIDAPKRLVVRGLYRYTRNPMYLGVLTTILGWALLFADVGVLIYGICVAAGFHLFVLLYEEPRLEQLFGAEYTHYRTRVNRWMPGIMTGRGG